MQGKKGSKLLLAYSSTSRVSQSMDKTQDQEQASRRSPSPELPDAAAQTPPESPQEPKSPIKGGTTSVETGKQLQERSEFFLRDQGKMFIGGLNWDTTESSLRDYFATYGEIVDLTIMRDSNTGRSRGFGFLTFKEPEAVEAVLQKQHVLDGKVIDPKRAIPKEEQDKTGKIFVGGIAPEVTEHDFDEFFSQFGNVIDAQLMIDKDLRRSRGFGFVTFDLPEAVDNVTRNHYLELKGKRMEIKKAEPRVQQTPGGVRVYRAGRRLHMMQSPRQFAQYNYIPPAGGPYALMMQPQFWLWGMPPVPQQMAGFMMPAQVPRTYGEEEEPKHRVGYERHRKAFGSYR